jgi:hypothetical protein
MSKREVGRTCENVYRLFGAYVSSLEVFQSAQNQAEIGFFEVAEGFRERFLKALNFEKDKESVLEGLRAKYGHDLVSAVLVG